MSIADTIQAAHKHSEYGLLRHHIINVGLGSYGPLGSTEKSSKKQIDWTSILFGIESLEPANASSSSSSSSSALGSMFSSSTGASSKSSSSSSSISSSSKAERKKLLKKLQSGEESLVKRKVCGKVFRDGDLAYCCETCQSDPTCVLCQDCFKRSNHVGHKVTFHESGGGCCDCGDEEAWAVDGMCDRHRPQAKDSDENGDNQGENDEVEKDETLPDDIRKRACVMFKLMCEYIMIVAGEICDSYAVPIHIDVFSVAAASSSSRSGFDHSDASRIVPKILVPPSSKEDKSSEKIHILINNDDIHTYDEVINVMKKLLKQSESEAKTKKIDEEGRASVWNGPFESKGLADAVEKSLPFVKAGLLTSISFESQVFRENVAVSYLNWLKSMSLLHPVFTRIIARAMLSPLAIFEEKNKAVCANHSVSIFMDFHLTTIAGSPNNTTTGVKNPTWSQVVNSNNEAWIDFIVRNHFMLPKQFGEVAKDLLVHLLTDYYFKSGIGLAYIKAYPAINVAFKNGIGTENESIMEISVQLLTVKSVVTRASSILLKEHRPSSSTLDIFIQSLDVMFALPSGSDFFEHHCVSRRRYSHLFHEFRYLFRLELTTLGSSDNFFKSSLGTFLKVLSKRLSWLNPQSRYLGEEHVEFESDDWFEAFHLEILLMYSVIKPAAMFLSSSLGSIRDVSEQEIRYKQAFTAFKENLSVSYDPTKTLFKGREYSLHICAHRLFGMFMRMASQSTKLSNQFYQQLLDVEFMRSFVIAPLSILAVTAQTHARLWVRNGHSHDAQMENYNKGVRLIMRDPDMFSLQVAASALPDKEFFDIVIREFGIRQYLTHRNPADASSESVNMVVENLLKILIWLVSELPAETESLEDVAQREVIHFLAANGPSSFSQISESVKQFDSESVEKISVENVIEKITTKKKGNAGGPLLYQLKPEMWDFVDPFYWHYSVEEQDKTVNACVKSKKISPYLVRKTVSPFTNVQRLLVSPSFISSLIKPCFDIILEENASKNVGGILVNSVHLIYLSLSLIQQGFVDADSVAFIDSLISSTIIETVIQILSGSRSLPASAGSSGKGDMYEHMIMQKIVRDIESICNKTGNGKSLEILNEYKAKYAYDLDSQTSSDGASAAAAASSSTAKEKKNTKAKNAQKAALERMKAAQEKVAGMDKMMKTEDSDAEAALICAACHESSNTKENPLMYLGYVEPSNYNRYIRDCAIQGHQLTVQPSKGNGMFKPLGWTPPPPTSASSETTQSSGSSATVSLSRLPIIRRVLGSRASGTRTNSTENVSWGVTNAALSEQLADDDTINASSLSSDNHGSNDQEGNYNIDYDMNDDEFQLDEDDEEQGMGALLSLVAGLAGSLATQGASKSSPLTSLARPHFKFCRHAIHQKCMKKYLETSRSNLMNTVPLNVINFLKNEHPCPLCKTVFNFSVPSTHDAVASSASSASQQLDLLMSLQQYPKNISCQSQDTDIQLSQPVIEQLYSCLDRKNIVTRSLSPYTSMRQCIAQINESSMNAALQERIELIYGGIDSLVCTLSVASDTSSIGIEEKQHLLTMIKCVGSMINQSKSLVDGAKTFLTSILSNWTYSLLESQKLDVFARWLVVPPIDSALFEKGFEILVAQDATKAKSQNGKMRRKNHLDRISSPIFSNGNVNCRVPSSLLVKPISLKIASDRLCMSLAMRKSDGIIVVIAVDESSPIQVGDMLLEVNGVSIANMACEALVKLFLSESSATLNLVFGRTRFVSCLDICDPFSMLVALSLLPSSSSSGASVDHIRNLASFGALLTLVQSVLTVGISSSPIQETDTSSSTSSFSSSLTPAAESEGSKKTKRAEESSPALTHKKQMKSENIALESSSMEKQEIQFSSSTSASDSNISSNFNLDYVVDIIKAFDPRVSVIATNPLKKQDILLQMRCYLRRARDLISIYGELNSSESNDNDEISSIWIKELRLPSLNGPDSLSKSSVLTQEQLMDTIKRWLSLQREQASGLFGSQLLHFSSSNDPTKIQLIQLHNSYEDLYNFVHLNCRCPTTKSKIPDPAICLMCGTVMCGGTGCCKRDKIGAVTLHSGLCNGGCGVFLFVKRCKVLLVHGDRQAFIDAPYVDEHGETDPYLKRGQRLHFSSERYELLTKMFAEHRIAREVFKSRLDGNERLIQMNYF